MGTLSNSSNECAQFNLEAELSFGPYKQVVAMKLMNLYCNNKVHNPHGFKEKFNIKYNTVKVVVKKFLKGAGGMIELLRAAVPPIDCANYCMQTPEEQLVQGERSNDMTKSMIFLMNSNNNNAKKDLRLAYSHGNKTAHPFTIKVMVRYISIQYPNKNSGHQRKGKKGDINGKKGNDPKSKDKDSNTTGTTGIHIGDAITPEDSATFSGGASISAHVLEATEQVS